MDALPPDCFILGDSAYPVKQWLMTPFKGEVTGGKSTFNYELSKSRQIIECAFGRLVERFRRLKFLQFKEISTCIKICIAATTLHNFCLSLTDDEEEQYTPEFNDIFEEGQNGIQRREILSSLFD